MSCGSANVTAFLLDGKDPTRVALRMIQRDHTYGELQSASWEVAKYLRAAGGQKGEPVLLVSDNSFFWVAAYLGILRAGLVCVPLPMTISGEGLHYILHTTKAHVAFVQARFAVLHKEQLRHVRLVADREVPSLANTSSFAQIREEGVGASGDLPDVERDDLAALMFTSGSTGKPCGVMVSHGNIMANTESIVQYLALTENDRIMTVLPFHYCFGTSLLHTHLRVGASLVIDPRFMYPERVLERMLEAECTGFAGVPSHFRILLGQSSLGKRRFPHLRYVQQAGGHLAPVFVRELRTALPTTQVFIMYGQTEATARLAFLAPESLDGKMGSIGKAIPGVRLRVVDQSDREVKPGEIGEIVAEGANVTRGYWNSPAESSVCFRNGRLYTGDLGTVDDEGFIYLVDRAKDFLKCGGERISCRQIEESLLEFEELVEAAVVGMPDEVLGEAVKAFVVPRDSAHNGLCDRLLAFCKSHMNAQLVPRKIIVLAALPKSANGKVLKQELKKWPTNGDFQPAAHFSPTALLPTAPGDIDQGTSARLTHEFIPVEKREIDQSTLEESIAAIWMEVLGISPMAVDDNFLDLGGTSLTAAQVLSRIYKVFGADVSMRSFFESPTLAGLALAVVHNHAKRIDQVDVLRILHELTGGIRGRENV
jgi:acyl-CoA synthetase (AMP-forming)/AMP-acid ligase II/acyl carrier protein